MTPRRSFDPRIIWSLVAAGICYAVGYPVALAAHSNLGWVLVFLGGPFLLTAGILTVRWVHRGAEAARAEAGPGVPTRPVDSGPNGGHRLS